MIIGIPKALHYYRYHTLWTTFFETLGETVVTSGITDKEMVRRGTMYAIDEACLSSKVYLGHVEALLGRCDMVFVPRIASLGQRETVCTKFEALYDIVASTFRDQNIRLLDCNIDIRSGDSEMSAFFELGKKLGKKKRHSAFAYLMAKQAERLELMEGQRKQEAKLAQPGLKILVVGHGYNVYDPYIGGTVLSELTALGATPVFADVVDRRQAVEAAQSLTDTLTWTFNKELVGAVQLYRDRVDGIILLSAFPCGPDSLVNEILLRRVKDMPILNLLLDNQEGSAGIETRLESFVDIIRFRQELRAEGG